MTARRPPLYDAHTDHGAKLTAFGGWEMPVQFDSINAEHESVRESVGKFDVSHMGQIEVTGPDALSLTDRLVTNDVGALEPGRAGYGAITDPEGVMLDDTITYRLGNERVLFVPNAGHDEEMAERWRTYCQQWDVDAAIENTTTDWAMFAIQGPDAEALAATVTDTGERDETAVRDLGRFSVIEASVAGVECLIARTGYTGEDGFELLCPAAEAESVWGEIECQPCGLGARDTLRIEAGLLLSGQDFDPETDPRDPYAAGIGFAVALDTDFLGRDALAAIQENGPEERLTGFSLLDRGVPRHGYPIVDREGSEIGYVTSGTMSPTLGRPIGLGYLPAEYAADAASEAGREEKGNEDGEIAVVIRGEAKRARVETPPFIDP